MRISHVQLRRRIVIASPVVERQLEMPPATIRNTGLGSDLTVVHSATAEE